METTLKQAHELKAKCLVRSNIFTAGKSSVLNNCIYFTLGINFAAMIGESEIPTVFCKKLGNPICCLQCKTAMSFCFKHKTSNE